MIKNTGSIWSIADTTTFSGLEATQDNANFCIFNDIIWTKTEPMPNFSNKLTGSQLHEDAYLGKKSRGSTDTLHYLNNEGFR